MKTYMPSGKNIQRKWYVVDAEGQTLGRLASQVAAVLRGKNKPEFTPFLDMGDYVIVVNADKVKLTGKKLEKKIYSTHTGQPGGLRETPYRLLMQTKPELAVKQAVKGMLPNNSIGDKAITRLKVYAGDSHKHEAQKPVVCDVK